MELRRLTLADLPACLELGASRGWSREEHKWRFLFGVGEAFGLLDPRDGLVGTAILSRFGGLAAVSMVLVAEAHGGRGLGRRLMEHVLAEAGDATVHLNATDQGRPLYEKLGFVAVDQVTRHEGVFAGGPAGGSRVAAAADLSALLDYDLRVYGDDRAGLLRRLPAFAEEIRLVESGGTVRGYAARWRNLDVAVLGPVAAEDLAVARTLIADLAAGAGAPVRMEVEHLHADLRAWLAANGLAPGFSTVNMVLGGRPLPGERAKLYLPLMAAVG